MSDDEMAKEIARFGQGVIKKLDSMRIIMFQMDDEETYKQTVALIEGGAFDALMGSLSSLTGDLGELLSKEDNDV